MYACCPKALHQAPGGRDNTKMVPRHALDDLSLASGADEGFYLRQDRIVACLEIPCATPPSLDLESLRGLEQERRGDDANAAALRRSEESRAKRERAVQAAGR